MVTFSLYTRKEVGTISTQYLYVTPAGQSCSWGKVRNERRHTPVGIENEGNVPHLAVRESLLEGYVELLESLAGVLDVVHHDGDVTETPPRVGVAADVALEVRVTLRAVIVGELEYACGGDGKEKTWTGTESDLRGQR